MTLQLVEPDVTVPGDRYLAAYAAVHSLLEEPTTDAAPLPPLGRGQVGPASHAASEAVAVIPAARLAHSTGGRRKLKRRWFRSAAS